MERHFDGSWMHSTVPMEDRRAAHAWLGVFPDGFNGQPFTAIRVAADVRDGLGVDEENGGKPCPAYMHNLVLTIERYDNTVTVGIPVSDLWQKHLPPTLARKAHLAFEKDRMRRFKKLPYLPAACGALVWWTFPGIAAWSMEYNRRRGKVVREEIAAQYGIAPPEDNGPMPAQAGWGAIHTIEGVIAPSVVEVDSDTHVVATAVKDEVLDPSAV